MAVVVLLGLTKDNKVSQQTPTKDDSQICYVWNTEAGDRATLKVVYLGDGKVSGFFNYRPAEKDSKVGTFSGSLGAIDEKTNSSTASLIWDSQAEGMSAKEELFVVLTKDTASPGFGEMKDSGNGMYVYRDPKNVSYSLVLNRVDCSDSKVEVPGFESDINITNASAS